MLRELISILRSEDPLKGMGNDFATMLTRAEKMTLMAGRIYFDNTKKSEDRNDVYKDDIKVNKLERSIRKQLIAHISLQNTHLPYCMLLMNLIKDVERIGDYAKNIAEVKGYHPQQLPDNELIRELMEIRKMVETTFRETENVIATSDRERAADLIEESRNVLRRCDTLIVQIADSECNARETTVLALGTRYYKRISAHLFNLLTSVVMPLHKLDYYDESMIKGDSA